MDKPQMLNLLTLARGLLTLPEDTPHFSMDEFNTADEGPTNVLNECGAVACAIGFGPTFGIAPGPDDKLGTGIYWQCYVAHQFGAPLGSMPYKYMFHYEWSQIDNTPHGAARRILKFLELGCNVPEGFEHPSSEYVL